MLRTQDIDLPTTPGAEAAASAATVFAAPTPGMSPPQRWLNKCSLAAEHVAAGDFASAMGLLNRRDALQRSRSSRHGQTHLPTGGRHMLRCSPGLTRMTICEHALMVLLKTLTSC